MLVYIPQACSIAHDGIVITDYAPGEYDLPSAHAWRMIELGMATRKDSIIEVETKVIEPVVENKAAAPAKKRKVKK